MTHFRLQASASSSTHANPREESQHSVEDPVRKSTSRRSAIAQNLPQPGSTQAENRPSISLPSGSSSAPTPQTTSTAANRPKHHNTNVGSSSGIAARQSSPFDNQFSSSMAAPLFSNAASQSHTASPFETTSPQTRPTWQSVDDAINAFSNTTGQLHQFGNQFQQMMGATPLGHAVANTPSIPSSMPMAQQERPKPWQSVDDAINAFGATAQQFSLLGNNAHSGQRASSSNDMLSNLNSLMEQLKRM